MKARTVFLSLLLPCVSAYAQTSLRVVNAASDAATVAPDSAVSAFGTGLTSQPPVFATTLPLPTSLNGMSVQVTDSAGVARMASLIFVSSTQVNFILPAATATGTATVTFLNGSSTVAQGMAAVQAVAPGLFSANGNGQGPAAAIAIQLIDVVGPQHTFATFQCDAPFQNCHTLPINLGVDAPTFLALFGTGIRGGKNVTVTVGGQSIPVLYGGAQGGLPGLDQVNIPLTLLLRGTGLVNVVVTVDGQASNAVQIDIQ